MAAIAAGMYKMKRFLPGDSDSDGFYDDNDMEYDDGGDEQEDFAQFVDSELRNEAIHLRIVQIEINQHVMAKAIEIAQNSFFWRFLSEKKQLTKLDFIYQTLLRITDSQLIE